MEGRDSYVGRPNSYRFSISRFTQTGKTDDIAEEFEEQDIWAVVPHIDQPRFKSQEIRAASAVNRRGRESTPSSAATPRRLLAASRMIPRSSLGQEDGNFNGGPRSRAQSAPVNIPDWSQINRKKGISIPAIDDEFEEDDDDDELVVVPPHQLVARQLATSQITPFSMCEGAGRTLKGRDLSRVRNAILTRTGFLE